ncbi:MAG: ABC transporter permease [Demequinaceae bacterium]|nr:ABC transporter permease [Demequinaceae bacterium]
MRRHALREVVAFEVRRTLVTKRFWLATLFIPGLLVFIFAVSFASGSSSDAAAQAQSEAHFDFEYLDPSQLVDPGLAKAAGGTVVGSVDEGLADVKSGAVQAFFAYPADPSAQAIEVYGANDGAFGNGKYATAAANLLKASASKKVGSPQLSAIVQGAITTHTTTFENGRVTGGIESVIPPLLYVVLLYIVIILMGNQMLSATVEEKENRVTEMILTTIRAKTLLIGKVISLFVIGFVQMLVFAIPVVVAYVFFRDRLSIPNVDLSALQFQAGPMVIGALLLAGSFSLFTATLIAVGAAMPTVKDAAPFFAGMVITLFLPIYAVSLIVTSPQAPVVQAFTFFPYTAPVTSLVRNALGSLPPWMAVLDIVMLFGLSAVVLQAAVGIFKYGSIEYGKKVSLKAAFARRDKR